AASSVRARPRAGGRRPVETPGAGGADGTTSRPRARRRFVRRRQRRSELSVPPLRLRSFGRPPWTRRRPDLIPKIFQCRRHLGDLANLERVQ
ncbi:hypothetical protein EE612_005331, partial [Oryza sativa]